MSEIFKKIRYTTLETTGLVGDHWVNWEHDQREALNNVGSMEIRYDNEKAKTGLFMPTVTVSDIEEAYRLLTISYTDALFEEIQKREKMMKNITVTNVIHNITWELYTLQKHVDRIEEMLP